MKNANASDQLRRILAIIPACADDRPHRIEEVAGKVGIDRKTFLKDLAALSDRFDDPGGFVEAVQIMIGPDEFEVHTDHFLRPMRLTLAELGALELGLAMLAGERAAEERPVIEGARERLRAAMAKLPEDPMPDGLMHAAASDPADPAIMASLRQAYKERRRARISYRKPTDVSPAERTLCPFAIVHATGQWYVIGHCEEHEGLRVFRIDRIERVDLLDQPYELPEGFTLEQVLTDDRAFIGEPAARVRIRYAESIARWIAERAGKPLDSRGCLIEDRPLGDPAWAVRHVLQYGPDAEILEPEEVRQRVREVLRQLATREND
jgi:proteasome accessory factor C